MTSDLTPDDLTTLRRLLEAATPGITLPVRVQRQPYGCGLVDDGDIEVAWAGSPENAATLAALVNAAPRLIEMAERAVGESGGWEAMRYLVGVAGALAVPVGLMAMVAVVVAIAVGPLWLAGWLWGIEAQEGALLFLAAASVIALVGLVIVGMVEVGRDAMRWWDER